MSWGTTAQHVIRTAVNWFFRLRGPEYWIFRGAVLVLVTLNGANWYFKYHGQIGEKGHSIELGIVGGNSGVLYWIVSVVCVVLMLGSVTWALRRYSVEQKRLARKKIFVIEARGLRDDSGAPLDSAVPASIEGNRTPYVLVIRQHKDGVIADPDELLRRVDAMKVWLHQIQRGNDRSDTTIIYGGLAAVPLTFLTGVLLDDEGPITVMDWDRSTSVWRTLDGTDDRVKFEIAGLDGVGSAPEVVLAVSVSYQVKSEDLATTFDHPVVRMTLPTLTSSHWSEDKQSALADQFFDTLKQLDALGVQQIHLALAAQNSVVFNLGRRYDKRNLPRVSVYQFERGQGTRYPWGIQMPVEGTTVASIVRPRSK